MNFNESSKTILCRSAGEYYGKELSGLKPNTFRVVDEREKIILEHGDFKTIEIREIGGDWGVFRRSITDITFVRELGHPEYFFRYTGLYLAIISWETPATAHIR